MQEFWDEKYQSDTFVYGKTPNSYFKEELVSFPPGRILLPGEGEGRNAVFAAQQGWHVDAIDWSERAKQKAEQLAEESNVAINYTINELSQTDFRQNHYDAIALIYVHLHQEERNDFFYKLVNALKPGGTIIFEGFAEEQLQNHHGGPKDIELLYSLESIITSFISLDFVKLSKEEITLSEGAGHNGPGVVIRFTGRKSK